MLSLVVVNTITIFRLFTGDGWSEIPTQIAANSSVFIGRATRVIFAVLFFVGGILGLSLVNSIFVDALAGDNNDNVLQRLDELEKNNTSLNEETVQKLFSRLDKLEKRITALLPFTVSISHQSEQTVPNTSDSDSFS